MFACFQPNIWVQPASAISPREASCWKPKKTSLGGGRCVYGVFSTQKRSSTRFGHHQQTFEYEATTFSFKLTKEGTAAT
jgi:hypothetical protein